MSYPPGLYVKYIMLGFIKTCISQNFNKLAKYVILDRKMIAVPKVWGKETWVVNNDFYCGKILDVNRGFRCSIHKHLKKLETFFLIEGQILMEMDDGGNESCFIMDVGDSVDIKPNTNHRFSAIKDSKIIEFSMHHDDNDSYRKTVSGKWLMI